MSQNDQSVSMIFTLEDDNHNAPIYENRQHHFEDSLSAIRQRYRRSAEILAAHRNRAAAKSHALDEIDDEADNRHIQPANDALDDFHSAHSDTDVHQEFRLPDIPIDQPEREYSLDDIDPENAPDHESMLFTAHTPDDEPPTQFTSSHTAHNNPTPPDSPPEWSDTPPATQQKIAQHAYLNYREHEHNQKINQSAITENEIGILIAEDWIAAQDALQTDQTNPSQTLHLYAPNPQQPNYRLDELAEQLDTEHYPPITVHVYDLPNLPNTRKIKIISEQELLLQLQHKLRPHLSNAVAGLMHHVLQKKLALLSYDLQMMLNEETPRLVEEILAHNMEHILSEIKDTF